jgi:hypothetical protein
MLLWGVHVLITGIVLVWGVHFLSKQDWDNAGSICGAPSSEACAVSPRTWDRDMQVLCLVGRSRADC